MKRLAMIALVLVGASALTCMSKCWVRNVDQIAARHPVQYIGYIEASQEEHWLMSDGSHELIRRGTEW